MDLCVSIVRLQEIQQVQRLREEEQAAKGKMTLKQQFEQKYEPCVVCGDKASGNSIDVGSHRVSDWVHNSLS